MKSKKMKKRKLQYAVIGLGMFGSSVAETLYQLRRDVLCVDIREDFVQEIADKVTHAVQADARDVEVLTRLGINNFDVAIVCIGHNVEASLMVTLALKEAGVTQIIAKATTAIHERALYKIGADRVVLPEREMGRRVARNASVANLIDYIELSDEYSIFEISCPTNWRGKTPSELDVRQKYAVTILGVKREYQFMIMTEADLTFSANDIIILLGSKDDFYEQLEKIES